MSYVVFSFDGIDEPYWDVASVDDPYFIEAQRLGAYRFRGEFDSEAVASEYADYLNGFSDTFIEPIIENYFDIEYHRDPSGTVRKTYRFSAPKRVSETCDEDVRVLFSGGVVIDIATKSVTITDVLENEDITVKLEELHKHDHTER